MALIVNILNTKEEKFVALLLKKLGYETTLVAIEKDVFGSILKKNNPKAVLEINRAKAYYTKLKKRNSVL